MTALGSGCCFPDPLVALAAARNYDFDIVLVDYEMPKIDGISFFIRELRSLQAYADVPIVMITSIESEDVRIRLCKRARPTFYRNAPMRPNFASGCTISSNWEPLSKAEQSGCPPSPTRSPQPRRNTQQREEIILRLALAVEIPR